MERLGIRVGTCLLAFLCLGATGTGAGTILLVRHAEKMDRSSNPDLSPQGRARAAALAGLGAAAGVTAVYTTAFCRTAQTVLPLAEQLRLPLLVQSLGHEAEGLEGCEPPIQRPLVFLEEVPDSAALADWIRGQHAGQTVLVVGHSNTVPEILSHLGGATFPPVSIDESDYHRLFTVYWEVGAEPRLEESTYGD